MRTTRNSTRVDFLASLFLVVVLSSSCVVLVSAVDLPADLYALTIASPPKDTSVTVQMLTDSALLAPTIHAYQGGQLADSLIDVTVNQQTESGSVEANVKFPGSKKSSRAPTKQPSSPPKRRASPSSNHQGSESVGATINISPMTSLCAAVLFAMFLRGSMSISNTKMAVVVVVAAVALLESHSTLAELEDDSISIVISLPSGWTVEEAVEDLFELESKTTLHFVNPSSVPPSKKPSSDASSKKPSSAPSSKKSSIVATSSKPPKKASSLLPTSQPVFSSPQASSSPASSSSATPAISLTGSVTRTISVTPSATNCGCPAGKTCFNGVCVGTGLISVTATWPKTGDGDIQVQTPGNYHIYWGQKTDPTGGTLDVDSVTNGPENIFWSSSTTPAAGTYHVCFDAYDPLISTGAYNIVIKVFGKPDVVVSKYPVTAVNPNQDCTPSVSIYVTSFTYP